MEWDYIEARSRKQGAKTTTQTPHRVLIVSIAELNRAAPAIPLAAGVALHQPWLVVVAFAWWTTTSVIEQFVLKTYPQLGPQTWIHHFAVVLLGGSALSYGISIAARSSAAFVVAISLAVPGFMLLGVDGLRRRLEQRRAAAAWQAERTRQQAERRRFDEQTIEWPMEIHLVRGRNHVLTLSRRRKLHVWDCGSFPPVLLQRESDADIGSVAVPVRPPLLFFGTAKRGIEVWDATSLRPIRQIDAAKFGSWIGALAVSPDSRFLAAGCGAQIVLFNLKTETVVSRIDATEAISPLLFSPDGAYLVAGVTDQGGSGVQTFRVVDSGLAALVEALDSAGRLDNAGDVILSASFNRDGRLLVLFASPPWEDSTADSTGEVFLYDVSTWRLLWHVVLDSSFSGTTTDRDKFRVSDGTDIACAPDDQHVICGGDDGTLFDLRASDGSLARRVKLPVEHRIVTFAIDDDRRVLWTANRDSPLKMSLDEIIA